ncbi:MAG: FMN-binding protein [Planctomycetota bacterium]|jgi:Na+-transporting NADH:ubiquinone oxidoreductase subunit C
MKEKLSMILFVLILGSVLSTALVSVNAYTAPLIEKNKVKKLRMSILKALGIAHFEDKVDEAFSDNVATKTLGQREFYVAETSGDIAFEIYGSGLWGPIHGIVALLADLKTIKGITIIHQEETPGLGGRIAETDFLDRFKAKKVFPRLIIQPPGKAVAENEVDGITGATLSCKAFEAILNSEIEKYASVIRENR